MNKPYLCTRCNDDFSLSDFDIQQGVCNKCVIHRKYFQSRPPKRYDKGLYRFHSHIGRQYCRKDKTMGFCYVNYVSKKIIIYIDAEKIHEKYLNWENIINFCIIHETIHKTLIEMNEMKACKLIDCEFMRKLVDPYIADRSGATI